MLGTTHAGNIGAAARAMKTMGLSRLSLVQPQTGLDQSAYARACGAIDILDACQRFDHLEAAVADCHWVFATSARNRHLPWPQQSARAGAQQIQHLPPTAQVAIVFGRESCGLTNAELARCNAHIHIPTIEHYGSLNVASAIQIVCYELRMAALEGATDPSAAVWRSHWEYPPATRQQMEHYLAQLEQQLNNIDFIRSSQGEQLMLKLRCLYARAQLDQGELNILQGILAQHKKQYATAKMAEKTPITVRQY